MRAGRTGKTLFFTLVVLLCNTASLYSRSFKKAADPVTTDIINFSIQNISGTSKILPLAASDADGTIVSFKILSLPTAAQGILYLNATAITVNQVIVAADASKLQFDANSSFSGNATFTYTSTDNSGATDATPATYTIPVVSSSQSLVCNGQKGPNILGAEGTFSTPFIAANVKNNCLDNGGAASLSAPTNNIGGAHSELTSYTYAESNGGLGPEGAYTFIKTLGTVLGTDATNGNCIKNNWRGADHTGDGGYFMAINGSPNEASFGKTFFTKTVSVCPNTLYEFSAWLSNVNPNTSKPKPNIRFIINGSVIAASGDLAWSTDRSQAWTQFGGLWYSGSVTSVTLVIENNTVVADGNDMGLDDISMAICGPSITYPNISLTPQFCSYGVLPLAAKVTSSISTYSSYIFQRSTNGGTTWTDISSPAVGNPVYNSGMYEYTATFGNIPVDPSMNGYQYRLKVATTSANLVGNTCNVYADQVITLKAFTKPSAGVDIVSCDAITSTILAAAGSGETWSASASNPAAASIQQTGQVTGLSTNGIYEFYLTNTSGCVDTVKVTRSQVKTAGTDASVCSDQTTYKFTDAPSGYKWYALSGNPTVATIDASTGYISGLGANGDYKFRLVSDIAGCADTVILAKGVCPKVSFRNASSSYPEKTGSVTIEVYLDQASTLPVTAPYALGSGTATLTSDYTATIANLVFSAGETSKLIIVDLVDDYVIEPDETVIFNLATPTNATLGTTPSHTLTIENDDAGICITALDAVQNEGSPPASTATDFTFKVSRTSGSYTGNVINFTYKLTSVSAGFNDNDLQDHTDHEKVISGSILAGQSDVTITYGIKHDPQNENDEVFKVTLLGTDTGVALTCPEAQGTVLNDDFNKTIIQFATVSTQVSEGNVNVLVKVVLSEPSPKNIDVTFALADITTTNNVDYTNIAVASRKVHFNTNDTEVYITLSVKEDTDDEADESLKFTLQDPGDNSFVLGSQTVHTITIVDDDPLIVQNDSFSTNEDTSLSNTVATNDYDPGGDPLTFSKLTNPAHGTVTFNANGTFTYTPAADYSGNDSFTYQACNSNNSLSCGSATVSITVVPVNDPPIANDDTFSGSEDLAITGTVASNDTDADADVLTFTRLTNPANGTLVFNSNGTFTYTPNANYSGTDSFTYQACDGSTCDPATVSLTVAPVNDPPLAVDDTFAISECQTLSGTIASNDGDPDNTSAQLTYALAGTYNTAKGTVVINANGTFTFTPTGRFTGPLAVNYRVTDPAGLYDDGVLTINQPNALLTVTVSGKTDVSCFGNPSGAINLSVSGGTAPYSYAWSDGETTKNIASLAAGTYSVTVTDANGCTATDSAIISQPAAALNISESHTNVKCFGTATGKIDITLTGGTAPYSYSWSNSSTNEDLNGIAANSYTVTVTDANGCTETKTIVIAQPAAALAISETHEDVKCFGASTGKIDITVTGGTAPYSYAWSNSSTSEDLTGLAANSYTVIVTDANGCTETKTITIAQPAAALTISETHEDVKCFGAATGKIDITVTGGTAPYSYAWSNSSTSEDLTGLAANSYTVTVTDANGCTETKTITIAQPVAALAISETHEDVKCFGAATGKIDITVSGGTAPYSYSWSNSSTNEDLTGLAANSYTVTMTDANGCSDTKTIAIAQPAAVLVINETHEDIKCFGTAIGKVDITVTGGTAPYSYSWSNGSSAEDLAGLTSNNYVVTVTDANGCSDTKTVVVSQPAAALDISETHEDVKCFGAVTGKIDITVSGGTAPYTYSWSHGSASEDLTSLAANSYTVTVTDANGCSETKTVVISQPLAALAISETHEDVKCFGTATGKIDITVTGGTAPYSYSWSNSSASEDLSGLTANSYTVTVTDANGCSETKTITISQPAAALAISETHEDVKCFGAATGKIDITVSGGTAPYSYSWSNGIFTEDLASLGANSYTVTVTDANGCTEAKTIAISQPAAALAISEIHEDVRCFGAATGKIDITVTGGTAPYSYAWSNGALIEDLTGLAANSYTVTVTDANGCTQTKTITIAQPAAALAISETHEDVKCFGAATGKIDLTVAGGTAPYSYSWSNGISTEDLAGLAANSYTVTVTDASGCTETKTIVIAQPAAALAISETHEDVKCFGAATGKIDITVSGGTAPYSFVWNNSSTTEDLNSIVTGSYTVTATDANGCTQTKTIAIAQPATALAISETHEDVKCFSATTGKVNITVTGGTAPYSYSWSNGSSVEDLAGLAVNSYTVTVTDANGCTETKTIPIAQPAAALDISETHEDVKCFGAVTGKIDITVSGGTAPYTYSWSHGSASEDLTSLAANSYTVTVTDANGCSETKTVVISQPLAALAISETHEDVNCFGAATGKIDITVTGGTAPYSFVWNNSSTSENLTGLAANSYTVTVTDANGCTETKTIAIAQPAAALAISETHENAKCFGAAIGEIDITVSGGTAPYSYIWSNGALTEDLNGLVADGYIVTVTDANGCTQTKTIVVAQPAAALAILETHEDVKCFGASSGKIDITVSGGTAPYSYSWSNSSTSKDLTGLAANSYTVTVTDANGCTQTKTIVIAQPTAALAISETHEDVKCFGASTGKIDISVSGGTAPYSYSWSNSSTNEDLTGLASNSYTVTVTDANGCTQTKTIAIAQPAAALAISETHEDVKCFGAATGKIDITVTGGTAPYSYSWSNGSSVEDLAGLAASSYTITITDANGCSETKTIFIAQPAAALAISETHEDVKCFGAATGKIDITVSGGTVPYSFAWSNSSSSEDLNSLVAGSYTMTVTDANGCTETKTIIVSQPVAALAITETHEDVKCFGAATGKIDISISGGTAPYSYSWSNSSTIEDLIGLAANSYTVTVTDANGCSDTKTIIVSQPAVALAISETHEDAKCFGAATGKIDINVSGGTAPYSFIWSNTLTSEDLNSLAANSYTVTVTDANGCAQTKTISIAQPAAVLAISETHEDVKCFGTATGKIDITVTGGTAPYSYSWSNNSINEDLTGLAANSYTMTVTDANGCSTTKTIAISQPAAALAISETHEDVKCFGAATGKIDITVSGGTAPYSYSWSNGILSEDLTGLVASSYTITITDANGCSETKTIFIAQPAAALAISETHEDAKCFGTATGKIDITVSGGTAPYSYSWSNGTSTEDLNGVAANSYTVTITDANGCTETKTIAIAQPAAALAISETHEDVKCFGAATGKIDITVTGGTAPYYFAWNNNSANKDLTDLSAGSYTVTITDANGCSATKTINIVQPAAVLAINEIHENVKCFGATTGKIDITVSGGTAPYSYSWSNSSTSEDLTALAANSYNVTVTDANGCSDTKAIVITQPAAVLSIAETHEDVKCFSAATGKVDITISGGTAPYSYSWSNGSSAEDLAGLTSNNYVVTVTDANGCSDTKTIVISQPAAALAISETHEDVKCFGASTGKIDISVSGGTAPYSYSWSNSSISEDLTGLAANSFTVTVTDANGCTQTKTIAIAQPAAALTISETHEDVKCFSATTGKVNITVTGGTAPYSYSWSNGSSVEDLAGLAANSYTVTVTDANGCTETKTIPIAQPAAALDISETHEDVKCFGAATGKINITATGGTAPYSYSWNNSSTSKDLSNILAGSYIVTVTDANGCSAVKSIIVIQPQQALAAIATATKTSCKNSLDGRISLNITGGTAPYLFAWSNNAPGKDLAGIAAGKYTVTITDKNNCSISLIAEVLAGNCIPLARNDSYTGAEDIAVTGSVAVNDSDPDGDPLTFAIATNPQHGNLTFNTDGSFIFKPGAGWYGSTSFTYQVCDPMGLCATALATIVVSHVNHPPVAKDDSYSMQQAQSLSIRLPGILSNDADPDGDNITAEIKSQAQNGSIQLDRSGGFVYIPSKSFKGTDKFLYVASDGQLNSNLATVTITIAGINNPPLAVDDAFTTLKNNPINASVAGNDKEPDNEQLTFSLAKGTANGTLNFKADGTFSYTPAKNFVGSDTFSYRACDPQGLCDDATVSITVTATNSAPIAKDDSFRIGEGSTLADKVSTNDTDPDGDPLSYSVVKAPANGTLKLNSDGTFTFIPAKGFTGTATFTYRACDPSGACDDAQVNILITPVAVVSLTPAEASVTEGYSTSITAVLSKAVTEDVTITLSFDGDAIANKDYRLAGNYITLFFAKGTTKTAEKFDVNAIRDNVKEDDEFVNAHIVSVSSAMVTIGSGSKIMIKDVYPPISPDVKEDPKQNPDIKADPYVSPNGDGKGNEVFVIYNIGLYPDNEVVIFNRWGNEVFRTKRYDNAENPFRGKANRGILTNTAQDLVDGVYYYMIYTKTQTGEQKTNTGYLILKR